MLNKVLRRPSPLALRRKASERFCMEVIGQLYRFYRFTSGDDMDVVSTKIVVVNKYRTPVYLIASDLLTAS
jgi:hypothetical protein